VEIIEIFWFTGEQNMGIVVIRNAVGQLKAYMGVVDGQDEELDTKKIVESGVRIHKDQLQQIINKLEGK
jgi:hypothetical protein